MDMIAIDIGNSTVSLAVFHQDKLQKSESIPLDSMTTDQLEKTLSEYRTLCGPQPLDAHTVPIAASSVNPPALKILETAAQNALNQSILLIGRDFPLEMKVAVENIQTLGPDRLINAFAAYQVIQSALVVADFGTATTVDCVNNTGIFLGGFILPGLGLAAQSLNDHTAALPKINITLPETLIGTNTQKAILSGIYYGAIGSLREITEQCAQQLGHWPQVIVTGGYANLIAKNCDFIDSVVPNLCLNGLYLAYRRFRESS